MNDPITLGPADLLGRRFGDTTNEPQTQVRPPDSARNRPPGSGAIPILPGQVKPFNAIEYFLTKFSMKDLNAALGQFRGIVATVQDMKTNGAAGAPVVTNSGPVAPAPVTYSPPENSSEKPPTPEKTGDDWVHGTVEEITARLYHLGFQMLNEVEKNLGTEIEVKTVRDALRNFKEPALETIARAVRGDPPE